MCCGHLLMENSSASATTTNFLYKQFLPESHHLTLVILVAAAVVLIAVVKLATTRCFSCLCRFKSIPQRWAEDIDCQSERQSEQHEYIHLALQSGGCEVLVSSRQHLHIPLQQRSQFPPPVLHRTARYSRIAKSHTQWSMDWSSSSLYCVVDCAYHNSRWDSMDNAGASSIRSIQTTNNSIHQRIRE